MRGQPRKLQSAVELACMATLIYTRHGGNKRYVRPDPHPLSRPGGPEPSRPDRCGSESGWGGGTLSELDRGRLGPVADLASESSGFSASLLHGDALGQVAGLVDVPAQLGRDVIGQQLQRDVQQHGFQLRFAVGDADDRVGQTSGQVSARDRDDRAAARLDLLDRGNVLRLQIVGRNDDHARRGRRRPPSASGRPHAPPASPGRGR
jgi:hypothetical protein